MDLSISILHETNKHRYWSGDNIESRTIKPWRRAHISYTILNAISKNDGQIQFTDLRESHNMFGGTIRKTLEESQHFVFKRCSFYSIAPNILSLMPLTDYITIPNIGANNQTEVSLTILESERV